VGRVEIDRSSLDQCWAAADLTGCRKTSHGIDKSIRPYYDPRDTLQRSVRVRGDDEQRPGGGGQGRARDHGDTVGVAISERPGG